MKVSRDIGIDARMIRHTGIGTYLRGVLGAFRDSGAFEKWRFGIYAPPGVQDLYPETAHGLFESRIYSPAEQWRYPSLLKECRLWHAPHYNVPLWKGKTRLVVTIHDLIHWIFRGQFFSPIQAFYAGTMLSAAVRCSDHIITVSEHTKQDLIRFFQADSEKVTVIYEAAEPRFTASRDETQISATLQRFKIEAPYFVYVGSLKPHKNVLRLIRLFREMKKQGQTRARLVLAGRKDRRYPRGYEELRDLESGGGVLHLEGVGDEDLKPLYQGALALIHPSLYEGFGLTLLEAMSSGTAVLASRSASIPEVTGEAACLVDSCQDHDMMQAIRKLETDTVYRVGLREKGLQRAAQFSWRETASKTLALYEKVLSER